MKLISICILLLVGCCPKQNINPLAIPPHISKDDKQHTQTKGECHYTEVLPEKGWNKMTVIECTSNTGERTISVRDE